MAAPIPCAHCGVNFMRRDLHIDAPKICNNCILKDQIRNPKKEVKVDKIQVVLEVDQKTHAEIEEICINKGMTFSEYFLNLHDSENIKVPMRAKMSEKASKKS